MFSTFVLNPQTIAENELHDARHSLAPLFQHTGSIDSTIWGFWQALSFWLLYLENERRNINLKYQYVFLNHFLNHLPTRIFGFNGNASCVCFCKFLNDFNSEQIKCSTFSLVISSGLGKRPTHMSSKFLLSVDHFKKSDLSGPLASVYLRSRAGNFMLNEESIFLIIDVSRRVLATSHTCQIFSRTNWTNIDVL